MFGFALLNCEVTSFQIECLNLELQGLYGLCDTDFLVKNDGLKWVWNGGSQGKPLTLGPLPFAPRIQSPCYHYH